MGLLAVAISAGGCRQCPRPAWGDPVASPRAHGATPATSREVRRLHPVWSEDDLERMDLAVSILVEGGVLDPTILGGRGLTVYVPAGDEERARALLRADARTRPYVVDRPPSSD